MRRRPVVALAGLTAAIALAAIPLPGRSAVGPGTRPVEPDTFRPVALALGAPAPRVRPALDAAARSDGALDVTTPFVEPGLPGTGPARPGASPPGLPLGSEWKPGRYTLSGYATFYDNGTTAMRLPRGTVVVICGPSKCIERTITDYGPYNVKGRIVDLYRPDFFAICGCAWYAGTAWVTVTVY